MAEENLCSTPKSSQFTDTRAAVLITLIDLAGNITYASASYQALLGYDPLSLHGRLFADLLHPNDLRDGKSRLVLTDSANAGMEVGWVRFRHAQGGWVWMEAYGPLVTDQGTSILIFVASATVADSNVAEQLHAVDQLESIRRLTRRVTHDMNNLLTGISGFANLALQTLPETHAGRVDLEQIRKATTRAAALIHQLRIITRESVLAPQVLQLNDLLHTMAPFLSHLIGTDIELAALLAPDLGCIQADPAEIEQVIVSLVSYVRDLLSSGGRIAVKTANIVLPAALAHTSVQRDQGDYVMLAVSAISNMDTDAQVRGREPDGMCATIIEQYGGLIKIFHDTDWETSIILYLPRVSIPGRTSQRSTLASGE